MLEQLDHKIYNAGQIILREGEVGETAYIIQSGVVELYRENVLIAEVGVNAIFGEMALIDSAPRMATAKAKTDVTLIILPKKLLDNKLHGVDPFVKRLIHILASNVRGLASHIHAES